MVYVNKNESRILLNNSDLKKLIYEPTTKKNHFMNIFVVGREGLTKSSLTFWLAKIFSGKSFKYVFDNFLVVKGMDKGQIERRLNNKKIKINIFDEFIKNAYNKEHYKEQAINLVKMWVESRSLKKVSFLTIPKKSLALKYFREGGSLFMFKLVSMGVAILFKYDDDNEKDSWNERANAKIHFIYITSKFPNINDVPLDYRLWVFSKYVNYVGEYHFDKVPDKEYEYYYKNYKEKFRFDYGENEIKKPKEKKIAIRLVKAVHYLKNEVQLTWFSIAEIVGLSERNIQSFYKKNKKELIDNVIKKDVK